MIGLTHHFVSLKGDGGDATLVRPSNWNAQHDFTCAANVLLGRMSAGAGGVEEIPASSVVLAALAATSGAGFLQALGIGGFVTGDVKHRLANVATPDGWILVTGTIGNAASGATQRANADTLPLWQALYDGGAPDTTFPVSGGRTGSSLNDFNAGKTMSLAPLQGIALVNVHGFSAMGTLFGEASHTLSVNELPAHVHPNSLNDGGHTHLYTGSYTRNGQAGSDYPAMVYSGGNNVSTTGSFTGMTITNGSIGNGAAHNNYQPSAAVSLLVKL